MSGVELITAPGSQTCNLNSEVTKRQNAMEGKQYSNQQISMDV